jgi:hypothetical protein
VNANSPSRLLTLAYSTTKRDGQTYMPALRWPAMADPPCSRPSKGEGACCLSLHPSRFPVRRHDDRAVRCPYVGSNGNRNAAGRSRNTLAATDVSCPRHALRLTFRTAHRIAHRTLKIRLLRCRARRRAALSRRHTALWRSVSQRGYVGGDVRITEISESIGFMRRDLHCWLVGQKGEAAARERGQTKLATEQGANGGLLESRCRLCRAPLSDRASDKSPVRAVGRVPFRGGSRLSGHRTLHPAF